VTLTSLTGALAVSMIYDVDLTEIGRSCGVGRRLDDEALRIS
jgi:hypothetical protein